MSKFDETKAAAIEKENDAQAAVDAVMKKYDRESNTREWQGVPKIIVYTVLAAFSVFVIYVTLFATWLDLIRYPSFVGCILVIGYLMYPVKKGVQKVNHMPWYDWIIMILGSGAFFYVVAHAQDLTIRLGTMNVKQYEIALGIIGVLALIELCRRAVGDDPLRLRARHAVDAHHHPRLDVRERLFRAPPPPARKGHGAQPPVAFNPAEEFLSSHDLVVVIHCVFLLF